MAEKRGISTKYTALAKAIINIFEELKILNDATIIYLESEHKKRRKGKNVYGPCERVQDKNKWAIPADFTITFYKPNMDLLKEEQKAAVVYHELLHVGYYGDAKETEIRPHDTEDFMAVLELFGVHWNEPKAEIKNKELLWAALEEAKRIEMMEELKNG